MSAASLFMVTLVVPDMDDGIAHFTHDWGFALSADTRHVSGHRWVEIDPGHGARLRLVEATTDAHRAAIGNQAGGRVAFFLNIDDFDATIARWAANGVEIAEPAWTADYGRVAVMRDRFGNRWDVLDAQFEKAA
ncbi:Glyoxalase-like domain protein [Tsuneonella dongtanensis]|uniref:Glyoxalase-like domain protein n=1 Tax=Tsuneonella dongtanensis TaxID=692370 RepID=A0A1B2AGY0_9SPHN|nr:VOC family protein [Tsuneonella dongtanensis]ANY21295.1 Glyoxalase-like domain protein [Tsuneonella dongtanensis]